MTLLRFALDGGAALELLPRQLVIAGWTGRDRAAIDHHIDELAAIGVPRPSGVPLYYRVAASLLTQGERIEVLGAGSSGEVEPVLVRAQGRWWLTVGSDHTDRGAERGGVALSKQLCAKPLATRAWPWDDVVERADAIGLRSEIFEHGRWVRYQDGTLAAIRPLAQLIAGLPADAPVADGLVLFCGTLAALPDAGGRGVRPAARMRLLLIDGAHTLAHEYETTALPQVA
ncbi:MAG: DUF2848 family protein [Nitrospira sp.]|nr:DUF2848 family protein [Nitrospira sp.]